VATFAIGTPGAKNAGLMAVQILSLQDAALKKRLLDWRRAQTDVVAERPSNQEKK
ncbi:MAG: AIR carboxylase family protein, partial [Pseudomonadota bacterium]|nr:AIR carboxylase family protein [Pseudomonadota bacterium]